MLLTCRTTVEKQAAAASTIHDVGSQDAGSTAGTGPQGKVGAEKMPALPRWDCNDGDTLHKRQRVCSKPLYCIAAGRCSNHSVVLWIADAPLRYCMMNQNTVEQQGAGHELLSTQGCSVQQSLQLHQCNAMQQQLKQLQAGFARTCCYPLSWPLRPHTRYAVLCM